MSTARKPSLSEQGLTALHVNWDVVAAVTLFLVAFALYARTAAPGVLDGDFGEFQTNVYLLGVSHTGYPLYFLLAKLWTLLMPVGNIAFRVNVFSGLFGALTLVMLLFTLRTLGVSLIVSLFASVLFGVSRVQWSQAVIPDVYTLNSFFIVLVLWLAILWRMGRVPLWWLALAYGLSLTHHRTMIMLAPALGLFVLWGGGRKVFEPRTFFKAAAALFLPLLLYVYVPLRGSSDIGVEYHAEGFADMILASNVSVWMRFGPPGFLWERFTQVYLALLVEQFTLIGIVFGLVGIVTLALKRVPRDFPSALPPRQLLLLIGLAHLAETAFAIPFWVIDSEIFFIPSYLTFLFFVALGVGSVWDVVTGRLKSPLRSPLRIAAAVGLVVWAGFVFWTNLPRNDQSRNDLVQARWQEILAEPLEENATFMGPWEDFTPLEYFQYVEGVRRDLKREKVVIYEDQVAIVRQGDLAAQAQRLLDNGTDVYLTRHPADTETMTGFDQWDAAAISSLWRIQPQPTRQEQLRETFGDEEAVRVFSLSPREPRAGDFLTVLVNWSSDTPLENIRLVLRLRDASERVWVEREVLPLGGRIVERDGNAVRDLHGIVIPPDAPPGTYTFDLAAFERGSQVPISLVGEDNRLTQTIEIHAPEAPTTLNRLDIAHPVDEPAGDARFLGYAVNAVEPRGGDLIEFSSWWQNIANAEDSLEIKLRDAADEETVLYQGALLPDSTGTPNPAQVVRARNELTIPPLAAAGYARVLVSLNGQAVEPIRLALGESLRKFRTPIVQRPQLTLVGDAIQLLGYKLDRTEYRPGEKLPVTLYWSANKTPDASYKVFVHFVDANGVLRTQRDTVPMNDTLPTSRWFEGEYITDEYVLNLPADLQPGEYRIVVGMYPEGGGDRVPLMDGNGERIAGDGVVLGDGITVK